ncbi:shikimate kinase [Candidatus Gracilibacteria bacterium]|nr:shikimate kinase [Candidatus Gracilibacteria bacterium]
MKIVKNIVLIGMRGSGKSAIGKTLAKFLDFEFIDVDRELERNEDMKIAELVKKKGWKFFRDLEAKYAKKAAAKKQVVIATGGGVVLREENVTNLKKNGIIVFIHSPLEQLAQRVSKDKNRPSLTGKSPHEELEEVWQQRKEIYRKATDVEVFFDFETKNKKADLIRKSKVISEAVKNFLVKD